MADLSLDDALATIDSALRPEALNDLQEQVFRYCWLGKTYQEMAADLGYDANYIRLVGFQLWKALSKVLDRKITKNNFRSVLRQYVAEETDHPSDLTVAQTAPKQRPLSQVPPGSSDLRLERPEGLVPLDSPFYIERPGVEDRCYEEVMQPGALIRIQAPESMGKTSLKRRILVYAHHLGYRTARLNFAQADEELLGDLKRFLRWFCANISQQLGLEPRLEDYWSEDYGSKVSCTHYVAEYLLEPLDQPLVLALDQVDLLFTYPELVRNVLPLLRSWHEEAKDSETWQKLRLIITHSTEIYVPLQIDQSPFNVGLAIKLPEFTPAQVQELAQRHGLTLDSATVAQLLTVLGGHPHRIRLALYQLARHELSLERLLQEAPTLGGICAACLRRNLALLREHPDLMAAMQQVITSPSGVHLDPRLMYQLESMGLVKLHGNQVTVSCELYRLFLLNELN